MKREIEELYQSKLTTAEEAVKIVKSGDRVYGGTAYALLEALWNRRHELEGVTLLGSNNYQYTPAYDESIDNPFLFNTYFMGINERKRLKAGSPVSYNSVHLSRIDLWAHDIAKPDVCFFEVSKPDEDGYMKFSIPWTFTIGYGITMRENTSGSFNYNTMRYPYKFTQNMNFAGSIRLSDGWNISFSSGYDFETQKISMTTASLSRDLHCFNMSCSVVLAPYTSYNFSFRCNAATLTDALKYDKRSSYSNAVQWY